ncbi:hypothetical protein [Streptomyces sp. NPDC005143]
MLTPGWTRATLSQPVFTGVSRQHLADLLQTSRFTIGRAVREIRGLLAARGFAVPERSGVRLRTLEDVFAFAEAEGVTLRIDGTEVQLRRPKAHRPGRKVYIWRKKKQNVESRGDQRRAGPMPMARRHPARPDARCHRAARRATFHMPGTDLVLARAIAC